MKKNIVVCLLFSVLFSFSQEKAKDTFHSTTLQAATIALEAQVEELIVGHFSSKYADLNILLEECKTIFKSSHLAIEGQVFKINRKPNFQIAIP